VNEVPPPAPSTFPLTVRPVAETPEKSSSDRQPPQERSQRAPAEQTAVGPGPGHTDPAVRLSETIARLQPGSRLEIQTAGTNQDGQRLIRSDIGQFIIDAGQNLERSVRYQVEIISTGTSIRAAVVAADGKAVTDRLEILLRPALTGQSAITPTYKPGPGARLLNTGEAAGQLTHQLTSKLLAAPEIQIGNQLNALLLTRQNEPGALPTPIIAGSSLVIRVLDISTPTAIGAAQPATLQQGTHGPIASRANAPPPPGAPQVSPGGRSSPLNRALEVAQLFRGDRPVNLPKGVHPHQAAPGLTASSPKNPQATAATVATGIKGAPIAVAKAGIAPGTPGSIITGIVVISAQDTTKSSPATGVQKAGSTTAATSLLVRTPIGLVRLNASDELPIGSTIALEVVSARSPEEIQAQEVKAPVLNLAATWPVLDEVMETLAATDPALAAQTALRALPAATPRLGPTLLFFAAALNLGDARTWLGQTASAALEKAGRHDLLRRLGSDFSRIRRASEEPTTREPASSEWRPTVFPFLDGGAVRPLTVFTRHGNQRGDRDGARETRFVLDVDLSALGPVQFDGLVRKSNFDLVVRSQKAFPEPMRDDIRRLFREAVDHTHLEGGIQFQTTNRFPVSPKDDYLRTRGHAADTMIV